MALPDPATLQRIFAFEPEVIEALMGELDPRVGALATPEGPVVTWEGRRLHSGRDPVREARRWARALDLAEATLVVVMGYASGYAIRALRQRTEVPILVFEPNLAILREGLGHGEVPEGIIVLTQAERLAFYLGGILQGHDRGVLATWTPSLRADAGLHREAMSAAAEAIGRAKLRHQTAMLRGPGWLKHFLANLDHITDCASLAGLRGGLQGVPAIIVAAGPSLDRNIHLLADLADEALILAVNTSARALHRAGIRPHALVSIESADTTSGIRDLPWISEIPAFLELTAHPQMWALPFARKIAIAVDTSGSATFCQTMAPGLAISAGFCVANASVAVANALGCDPIVLIGSDLAYAGERVYATGTIFEDMRAVARDDGSVTLAGTEARRAIEAASSDALAGNRAPDIAHTVQVPSYDLSGTVTTSPDFKMFRDWYTYAADRMEATLINATEGGAHIPGWRHEPLQQVIERHGLDSPNVGTPLRRRFAALIERPPLDAASVRAALAREHEHVLDLLAQCREALEIVQFDPDGDLDLAPAQAQRITDINARVRSRLRDAPLAGEACFAPIQQVRTRGELTTFAFYAAIERPLREVEEELARLLQNLSTQHDAARETAARSA